MLTCCLYVYVSFKLSFSLKKKILWFYMESQIPSNLPLAIDCTEDMFITPYSKSPHQFKRKKSTMKSVFRGGLHCSLGGFFIYIYTVKIKSKKIPEPCFSHETITPLYSLPSLIIFHNQSLLFCVYPLFCVPELLISQEFRLASWLISLYYSALCSKYHKESIYQGCDNLNQHVLCDTTEVDFFNDFNHSDITLKARQTMLALSL